MRLCRLLPLLILAWVLAGRPAEAHFLFARILPPAEGGRAVEVYFSELAAAGDPRYIAKISQTQLWLQSTPGTFEALKVHATTDRLRAWLPGSGNAIVVGSCTYGVLGRENQPSFLLRHFPKALDGTVDALNGMKPYGKLPLEVVATVEGGRLHLMALKDGRPVPKAEFVTVDSRLVNTKVVADANGKATWQPPSAGVYSVYTRDTRRESGEYAGKKYTEIRDFATVALAWPLGRTDADADAVTLFEEAVAARAQWHDFKGFSARITGNCDGRRFAGTVDITATGEVTYEAEEPANTETVSGWVEEQLRSLAQHRIARPATAERRRPIVRFAPDTEEHPLGRLLIFDGGQFASSYRVKDKQLLVVNRLLGKENLTITALENDRNAEGRFLPRSYAVQYWEAGSGRLVRTETIQDRWQRVGSWDLPTTHTVTTVSVSGLSVKTMTLSKHAVR